MILLDSKKLMKQDYECKFCGAKFRKETTLTTHVCVKKERHAVINTPASRLGLRAFQKFYEMTMNSKKLKTAQEFIDSQFYIDFAKFGNHLATLKPVYPEQFIEFVIRNSIDVRDWTNDVVYYAYVEELCKKEPPVSAVERTITEIMEWCDKNTIPFKDFFFGISANEGAHLIKSGKISPWVLYLSSTGEDLVSRFNEDHSGMVGGIIDPGYWMRKFKKSDEDVEYIRGLLDQAGI
jgi:hypothetical protein